MCSSGPIPLCPTAAAVSPSYSAAGTEVGLTIYPPGSAPNSPDIFDYKDSTSAGPRLLFSVQPVPPEQGSAKELAFHHGSRGLSGWYS